MKPSPINPLLRPVGEAWIVFAQTLLVLLLFGIAVACVDDSLAKDGGQGNHKGNHKKDPPPEPPPPPPEDPLLIRNKLTYPTRIATGTDGKVYVSDAKVGSIFIYESSTVDGTLSLKQVGELKGLDKPLGVAVDGDGNIYVGNDGLDNVEKYDSKGEKLSSIGNLLMPTDLALDSDGNLYVADSRRNTVEVFDSSESHLRTIGASTGTYGGLDYPVAVEVHSRPDPDNAGSTITEVFVASHGTYEVHVFDLLGNHKRNLGGQVTKSFWGSTVYWEGKFQRIQDLSFDTDHRLHVLDCALNNVQILDPVDGAFVDSYGAETFDPSGALLKVPLGLALTAQDKAVVANTHRGRLELFQTVP